MAKTFIGNWNGVPTYTQFLPFGTRRSGQKLTTGKPKFLVFHDTGNPNSTAQGNVNYYTDSYNAQYASAHIFVDDKECIICIPLDEKAWHVIYDTPIDNYMYNLDANDAAIGIETAYFTDRKRSLKSLDNGCRIAGYLCRIYNLNPNNQMPGHQDIQSDKQDPGNLLAACGYGRNQMGKYIDPLVVKYKTAVAPKKTTVSSKTAVVKKSPKWVKNKDGVLWVTKNGKFKNGNQEIHTRVGGPWRGWPEGPVLKPNDVVAFNEMQDFDGFLWVSGKYKGKYVYVPIGSSNGKGSIKGNYWGKLS